MKRPPEHVTDTLGQAQVRRIFEPLGWTVNRIDNDYGADFEVEVFKDGKTTGIAFKVQLKSSENTPYASDGLFISQSVTVPQARYQAEELETPVLLIHADIASNETFWCTPQLDDGLASKLSNAKDDSDVVIRVPTSNALPGTLNELQRALSEAASIISSRNIARTPLPNFVEALAKNQKLRADAFKAMELVVESLRLDDAQASLIAEDPEGAIRDSEKLLRDINASMESKIGALLVTEVARMRLLQRQDGGDDAMVQLELDTAKEIRKLTNRGPAHLKFFALIQLKAAELYAAVHRDWGLFLAAGLLGKDAMLIFTRAQAAGQVNVKYRQCMRLLDLASRSNYRWAATHAVVRVAAALPPLIIRLREEGRIEAADNVRRPGSQS